MGFAGRAAAGAEDCGPACRTAFRPERKTPPSPRRLAMRWGQPGYRLRLCLLCLRR